MPISKRNFLASVVISIEYAHYNIFSAKDLTAVNMYRKTLHNIYGQEVHTRAKQMPWSISKHFACAKGITYLRSYKPVILIVKKE